MSKHRLYIFVLLLLGLVPRSTLAQTVWHVDDDCSTPGAGTELDPFCSIQDGVNAASDGDSVLVGPGIYTGDGNRDISLFGKSITLKSTDGPSSTIMDIEGSPTSIHRGFFLIHGETTETIIEGLTVINAYLIGDTGGTGPGGGGGGAIYIRDSSPTIHKCIIRSNISATLNPPFPVDGRGAGIYVDGNSGAVIANCVIADNIAARRGGGMYVGYAKSQVVIRDCLLTGNIGGGGGGLYNTFANTVITNTAIVNNAVEPGGGGGGLVSENSDAFFGNCVLWGNEAEAGGPQISISGRRVLTIEYSNVQGGLEDIFGCCNWEIEWGLGMIDADPLFSDPENEDFRFLHGSPCIDAANNMAVPEGVDTDLDGGPRFLDDPSTPDTGNPDPDDPKLPIVDMGPYEFDPEDCNNNDVPDEQDLESGESSDIDENGIPDECQVDCNSNGIPDSYEISEGMSEDRDANGVPDECQPDCPDEPPGPPITQQPVSQDVEVGEFAFFQVQADGVLLEYQWRKDSADLIDTERILGSLSPLLVILDIMPEDAGQYDCVITDSFDFGCSTSDPATLTVLSTCPADINDDGVVGPVDLAMLLGSWGSCPDPDTCPADLNADGVVNSLDLAQLLAAWGACP